METLQNLDPNKAVVRALDHMCQERVKAVGNANFTSHSMKIYFSTLSLHEKEKQPIDPWLRLRALAEELQFIVQIVTTYPSYISLTLTK